eukprot:3725607-Prymnesium_polylepis.1
MGGLQAGVGAVADPGARDAGRGADRDVGEGHPRPEALPAGGVGMGGGEGGGGDGGVSAPRACPVCDGGPLQQASGAG